MYTFPVAGSGCSPFSQILKAASRRRFSLSLPILSSASLLAYQDWECMENNKENDNVSYKGGGGCSRGWWHCTNQTREACRLTSVHSQINLLMHEGNNVFSGSLYCLVNLAPEQQTSTSLRVESWPMKESFFSFWLHIKHKDRFL